MNDFLYRLCDNCVEILIICFGIAFIIFSINIGSFISNKSEESCFEFYDENKYILNSCEKYRDKLEAIHEKNL